MSNAKILVFGLLLTAGLAAFLFWPGNERQISADTDGKIEVVMYKNEGCQCCTKWAAHMNAEEFAVEEKPTSELNAIKQSHGITPQLSSCHTAIVDGYVVEGHVPVADVQRMLKEKPDAVGLTVPGMPTGSPGMEMPGRPADNYDVLLINKDGSTSVYASY